jgi:hypothetical protein
MKEDSYHFRSRVLSVIQPLSRGTFDVVDKVSATLKNLIPFGSASRFQHALPFGMSSNPISSILAYHLNMHGNAQAPVILTHLDINRPIPGDIGGLLFYCTTEDGTQNPVTIELSPQGKLIINSTVDVEINSPNIKLGATAADPIPLGNELQSLLSEVLTAISSLCETIASHTHLGNLGFPTSAPTQAADFTSAKTSFDNYKSSPVDDGSLLSGVAFTQK